RRKETTMRHLIMGAAAALVLVSCAAPGAAPAPPPQAAAAQCVPVAALRSTAQQRRVPIAKVEPVAPFLAALNRLPPPSDYAADEIYVLHLDDIARLILVTGGCAQEL